ncbi:MAG: hypothetical protein JO235_22580, partial [Chroococcidiopsidaceae cyanobacterium CP_BM_RX_35]|nr:hypothetical protein [Chroococcidiopsidaceae cyanobacterium CP_BM_RX_35]
VRQNVAEKYAELIRNDPKRAALDRKGKKLTSCGDTDLAFTACDIGLGTGLFKSLKLTHLIPANRLEESYLLNLVESLVYSHGLLDSFRNKIPTLRSMSWRGKLFQAYQDWKMNSRDRRFAQAKRRGYASAVQEVQNSERP